MPTTKITRKAEATAANILDSALVLFRETGFDKTTMRDIAAKAGVATGAAYYYYPSKDSVVLAFYERSAAEMAPPRGVPGYWCGVALAASARDLAAAVVELAVDLVLEEHDRGDDGEGDERDEEDVLHHARPVLILGEFGLEPGTKNEEVHDNVPFPGKVDDMRAPVGYA